MPDSERGHSGPADKKAKRIEELKREIFELTDKLDGKKEGNVCFWKGASGNFYIDFINFARPKEYPIPEKQRRELLEQIRNSELLNGIDKKVKQRNGKETNHGK